MPSPEKHDHSHSQHADKANGGLSTARKVITISQATIQTLLLVVAMVDLIRRPAEQINGDKRRWFIFLFTPYIGPISYLIFGRKREHAELPAEVAETAR